jgi:ribosomal protein S27E
MFEREQRLEMQVNCPECGNSTIAEFCNATGATRHIDCDSCRTRFVAHLGAEHQLITKLVPVSATSSSIPVEMMKCPHCGCVQSAPISTQPGTTRHLVCNQCTGNFIVHRKTDGSIYSKGMPIVGSSQTRFETFLRKTKFWIEPSFVAVLIEKACEADTKLMESGDIKTPKRLESAMIEVGLPHSAKTANIFVKILVFGGAFQFEPDTSSAPFYKQFTNPLHAEELVRSIYRGLIYRLRNQFPEMGIESIQELRDALHIDIVELGFPAVNINQELQEVLHLKASSSTEQVLPQAAADD